MHRITKKQRIALQLQKEKQKREKACERKRKQREKEKTKQNQMKDKQKTKNHICDIEKQKLLEKRRSFVTNDKIGSDTSATTNNEGNLHFDFVSEKVFIQTTKEFDTLNDQLTYRRCTCCRQVKLELRVERQMFESDVHQLCTSCKYYSLNEIKQVQQSLPVWWDDDDQIQFQLSDELINLREGEKLMIQKYSAYIPIHHLYKGQVGAKGHCCAFKQNIMDVTLVLPRKPEDIKFVQVIKKYKDKSGNIGEKKFVI